jgi:chromosomal replication initiator protein
MRVAILKKKAEARAHRSQRRCGLPDRQEHLRSNVRELEGALKKVLAFAHFHMVREINLEVAAKR